MKKIAILHTARATVPLFHGLISQRFGDVKIYDWLDDSILPMLAEDEESLKYAFEKLLTYSRYAERQGVGLILNACSSVGEFKNYAEHKITVPVLRIDDPVTDILAERYHRVGILATLGTTLRPSTELLRGKKETMELASEIVNGAYMAASEGKQGEHDRLIAEAVIEMLGDREAVFLAQASMAQALRLIPEQFRGNVYTSTEYVMDALEQYL